jgi:hypothetical protein
VTEKEKPSGTRAACLRMTLRGLLPICASCKTIRDDSGYWNQMEAYISIRREP